jgi:hypothetical protein
MIMKQDSLVKVARRVITHHEDLAAALEALRVTRAKLPDLLGDSDQDRELPELLADAEHRLEMTILVVGAAVDALDTDEW